MAYYIGRDVIVAVTTEDVALGVDVTAAGVLGTFAVADGSTDTVFAGARAYKNLANSPTSGIADRKTVFGTQGETVTADYTNEVPDLTAVDVSMSTTDEDITYIGSKQVMKTEIKKEATLSITRKKTNNCWEVIFNSARHGVESANSFHGNVNPARSDYGYRVFLKLKSEGQVLTLPNCCVTGHGVTISADGVSEETLEFYSYGTPIITAGTDTTSTTSEADPVGDTTLF